MAKIGTVQGLVSEWPSLLVPRDDLEDGDVVEISQSISDQGPSLHFVAPSGRSLYPACLMLPSS